jgi:hypothetical protein
MLLVAVVAGLNNYDSGEDIYNELLRDERFTRSPIDAALLYYRRERTVNETAIGVRIAVVCNMHARELITGDVCMHLVRSGLLSRFEREAINTALLFVPLLNARGRDRALRDACWRGNEHGVDLNRNWPISSAACANVVGVDTPGPPCPHDECYAGQHALSEVETRAFDALLREFRPHVLLSLHSGTRALLLPFDSCWRRPRNYAHQVQLANWLRGDARDVLVGSGLSSLYAANGTLCDYAHDTLGVPVCITAEVYGGEVRWPRDCERLFNPPRDSGAYEHVLVEWGELIVAKLLLQLQRQNSETLRKLLHIYA